MQALEKELVMQDGQIIPPPIWVNLPLLRKMPMRPRVGEEEAWRLLHKTEFLLDILLYDSSGGKPQKEHWVSGVEEGEVEAARDVKAFK